MMEKALNIVDKSRKELTVENDSEKDTSGIVDLYGEEREKANDVKELPAFPGSQSDISNIYKTEDYDASGCPIVPIAFSGMVGHLGNVMCTYSNFIAIQWKLGFKYFLPKYMNNWADKELTKPYLQSIFKNVSFPTATWTNISMARNAEKNDLVLFSNSLTQYKEVTCNKQMYRVDHLQPTISDQLACAQSNDCKGQSCLACKGSCLCADIWVTQGGGANYLDLDFVGDVLEDIIKHNLQFKDEIVNTAVDIMEDVARNIFADDDTLFVGVHVRRSDFHQYSKFWLKTLLNETFFEAAMDHFRKKHSEVVFLVVSDDMEWCRRHLTSQDTIHVGSPSPEVDLAIMANCNASIIDYGTYGMWGAIMAGGETVTSTQTFRDNRWAADYFGWTYV